ncbi:BglG family transcription antiterminator [Vagococcus xieshaowenii]
MFSSREKTLINYLLDSPDGRTRESLEEWLGVSKRTLYRELSSIEQTLQKRQLSLIKPQKGSYAIVGGEEELLKLQQDVANNQVDTPSIVERQSNLACMLLLADDFLIAEGLAIDLLVSESTIYNDLSVIEQSFEAYNLSLLKKKNSGIIVTGRENERRQLLSNLIYSGTSEYEFFSWINQLMTKFEVPQPSNNFFTFISNEALIFSINQMKLFAKYFGKVTDNQIKQVMIIIALAYDRISQLHFIEQSPNETVQSRKKEHIMANEIIENLSHNLSMEIPLVENQYLEKQLQGVNYKEPQNLLFDTFNISLSFKVRDLIKKVSLNYGVDFSKDEQCYYDLLTHLDAAIRRSDSLPVEIGSPVLQGVKAKYAGLYEEIITGVKEVFPSVQFNGDEIGYLLLHFATSLERYPETTEISALIFCSSGMGTSKILESRFIKYLPEISQITVAKLSEMDQIDFRQFDLIFQQFICQIFLCITK